MPGDLCMKTKNEVLFRRFFEGIKDEKDAAFFKILNQIFQMTMSDFPQKKPACLKKFAALEIRQQKPN